MIVHVVYMYITLTKYFNLSGSLLSIEEVSHKCRELNIVVNV